MLSYPRAIFIGILQGVTELFPISSLGHSLLIPALLGWDSLVTAEAKSESYYLAFLVALHVATAIALLIYFRAEWIAIVKGLFLSARERRVANPDARLGLLIIVASLPVGIVGIVFEHALRVVFAKPMAAAIFLTINGVMLLVGEGLRRRTISPVATAADGFTAVHGPEGGRSIDSLTVLEALFIGASQIGALFAGISRSGITMVAGMMRGLNHEDAARFSFLLATPIILAAGMYKIPDLLGSVGDGVRGQALAGAIAAGIAAYLSTRFLLRFFETQSLKPFGIYCLVFGTFCMIKFA